MRQLGKSKEKMELIHKVISSGGKYWISTRNRYWFMARFKDAVGVEVELVPSYEGLYEIKIKK